MVSKDLDERRLQTIIEAVRSSRRRQIILEAVNTFEVYRSDTGVILTRGVRGYEAAKDKANEIRKRFGLKWEQGGDMSIPPDTIHLKEPTLRVDMIVREITTILTSSFLLFDMLFAPLWIVFHT